MPIANVQELLVHELAEIYDAEHRFLDGQVEMVHRATDHGLQRAIENHIAQTRQHIENLEQFFRELGQEPRRETNEVARVLVSEAEQSTGEARSDVLRDCLIDAAVIKVEHFEIGSYRAFITGVRLMMGQSIALDLIEANLGQEEEAARIAEQSAEELLQKAMRAEVPEQEGMADKINRLRDRLPGQ